MCCLVEVREEDGLEFVCETLGLLSCRSFGVDADDGLGIASAHMYPLCREVNLHPVNEIDIPLVAIFLS